jgi:hypothetical protein
MSDAHPAEAAGGQGQRLQPLDLDQQPRAPPSRLGQPDLVPRGLDEIRACNSERGNPYLWQPKGNSTKSEAGRWEATPMDFKDRRIWYGVAVVIVVLTIIGYATGWSNGAPAPAPQ